MSFLKNYLAAKEQSRLDKADYEAKQAKKFQGAVANMMIGYSFDGQFEVQGDGSLEFKNALGGKFKGLPSVTEAFSKYKRLAKQYGQEPDLPSFTAMYKDAEANYANAFLGKLRSMENAGHKQDVISNAILSNPELTKTYNHFLGTALAPKLKPYAPKAPGGVLGGVKDAFSFTGAATLGAKGAGIARLGALKGGVSTIAGRSIGKEMDATRVLDAAKKLNKTQVKSTIDVLKSGGDDILKSSSKGTTLKTLKPALEKYIKKYGVSKLLREMAKNAGLKGAVSILGKGILGTGLTASGIGTAAGLALDAMTIYEIMNLVQEVTSEVEKGDTLSESILGGDVSAPAGTIY